MANALESLIDIQRLLSVLDLFSQYEVIYGTITNDDYLWGENDELSIGFFKNGTKVFNNEYTWAKEHLEKQKRSIRKPPKFLYKLLTVSIIILIVAVFAEIILGIIGYRSGIFPKVLSLVINNDLSSIPLSQALILFALYIFGLVLFLSLITMIILLVIISSLNSSYKINQKNIKISIIRTNNYLKALQKRCDLNNILKVIDDKNKNQALIEKRLSSLYRELNIPVQLQNRENINNMICLISNKESLQKLSFDRFINYYINHGYILKSQSREEFAKKCVGKFVHLTNPYTYKQREAKRIRKQRMENIFMFLDKHLPSSSSNGAQYNDFNTDAYANESYYNEFDNRYNAKVQFENEYLAAREMQNRFGGQLNFNANIPNASSLTKDDIRDAIIEAETLLELTK